MTHLLLEKCREPMTVGAKRLKIGWIIVGVIAINVINIELTVILRNEATSLAFIFLVG
jgi:hypothetical protein